MPSAVDILLADLQQQGVHLEAHGDRLRYCPRSALTPELVERLKAHKVELLAALRAGGVPGASIALPGVSPFSRWVQRSDWRDRMGWEAQGLPDEVAWWRRCDFEDLPEPGNPCPKCGSLEYWTDLLGGRHCQHCDGDLLRRGLELVQLAGKIRNRKE